MRYFFSKQNKISVKIIKKIKFFLIGCFSLIVFCCILMCIPTSADAELYDNVIRLHVIANSDNELDQKIKLEVRDAVIDKYTPIFSGYVCKADAERTLEEYIPEINKYLNQFIKNSGYEYTCTVELGEEHYGRTVYERFSMPAGKYTSLRIIIGEGEGKNWWCVLFPPLCTKAAVSNDKKNEDEFIEVGFTGEQYNIITKNDKPRYKIKFRLLELFFGG